MERWNPSRQLQMVDSFHLSTGISPRSFGKESVRFSISPALVFDSLKKPSLALKLIKSMKMSLNL